MNLFDGPGAAVVGRIMARANAEAEDEAVERLDPAADARILVLGFGPGVGIASLVRRSPQGFILGVDPSAAMLGLASRRNRAAIGEGRVRLARTTADRLDAGPASFDGAIAVNTLQLCEPIAATAAELARVLRPGARLMTLTHDWAAAKHAGSADASAATTLAALAAAGFRDGVATAGRTEKGRSIVLSAIRG